ncbi:unnamed protein product [Protopolystoma xenopodis]|uniref:Uncharacterized protein n=1 Tax=Protopolystoma xenopodis TaxID=117903 RepID=A0A3S5AFH0_9PLAT|nr:unnamed protein product [Protopolystoma xenopodis]
MGSLVIILIETRYSSTQSQNRTFSLVKGSNISNNNLFRPTVWSGGNPSGDPFHNPSVGGEALEVRNIRGISSIDSSLAVTMVSESATAVGVGGCGDDVGLLASTSVSGSSGLSRAARTYKSNLAPTHSPLASASSSSTSAATLSQAEIQILPFSASPSLATAAPVLLNAGRPDRTGPIPSSLCITAAASSSSYTSPSSHIPLGRKLGSQMQAQLAAGDFARHGFDAASKGRSCERELRRLQHELQMMREQVGNAGRK